MFDNTEKLINEKVCSILLDNNMLQFHELFASIVARLEGNMYIWGGAQTPLTQEFWERIKDIEMKSLMKDRIGKVGSDCSGILYWGLKHMCLGNIGRRKASEYFAFTNPQDKPIIGSMNFYSRDDQILHVNVYLSEDKVLNASISKLLTRPTEISVLPADFVNEYYLKHNYMRHCIRSWDLEKLKEFYNHF